MSTPLGNRAAVQAVLCAFQTPRTLHTAMTTLLSITLLFALPATAAEEPVMADAVRNVIIDKCLTCHSGEKPKGGLDLTRRSSALKGGKSGVAIVPSKPDESPLLEKVIEGEMPPKSPLSQETIATIRDWLTAGAPYPSEPLAPRRAGKDWWSLQPLKRVDVPKRDDPWVRTPVDGFIFDTLKAKGLKPSPEASRAELIRRITFDLHGLPPTPEEVHAFENDSNTDAYERLVDTLLASPRYGERWGRHWLDVVRFAESHGYEMNQPRDNAWPYRDYVIRSFNLDTPFPRFVLEQLAADTLENADVLTRSATGFLVGGAHDQVGNATVEGMLQQRADDLDDVITATCSAFLGLTVNCARCHDHKFDPIFQKDYYGLAAVFAGVTHADREVPAEDSEARRAERNSVRDELSKLDQEDDRDAPLARPDRDTPARPGVAFTRNVERFPAVVARGVRFTVLATNNDSEPCIDELEAWSNGESPRNVALDGKASASSEYPDSSIHKIMHLNDGQVGNSRSWISRAKGRGRAEITWKEPVPIDRVVWGRDREGKFKDRLPTFYYVELKTETGWTVVASSSDRALPRESAPAETPERIARIARKKVLQSRLAELGSTRKIYAGMFNTPAPTFLLRRGDPSQKGDPVVPSAPGAVGQKLELAADTPEPNRRAALARWLGDPANPLPARVMVNRAWHYHFGRGIVATPSDFGFNGATPSNPALLDWLAGEFQANSMKLKPIHRLILLSSTYRQSSHILPDSKGPAIDKDDVLLWRFPPRRLEAEPIRDAILSISGKLDLRMGGPGYSPWIANDNYVRVFNPKPVLGPTEFRRMIYQYKPRSRQDPTFGTFDCPDAALVAPRRTVSTTALQALSLLNSRFITDQSEFFADRLKAEAGENTAAQADRAFNLAFARSPDDVESRTAAALIREHGLPAFCRAIFNANEFVYIP